MPPLMERIVAIDAFSQAFTNPLLSEHVFNESTFSTAGLEVIEETSSLQDVLDRNLTEGAGRFIAMMTQARSGTLLTWQAKAFTEPIHANLDRRLVLGAGRILRYAGGRSRCNGGGRFQPRFRRRWLETRGRDFFALFNFGVGWRGAFCGGGRGRVDRGFDAAEALFEFHHPAPSERITSGSRSPNNSTAITPNTIMCEGPESPTHGINPFLPVLRNPLIAPSPYSSFSFGWPRSLFSSMPCMPFLNSTTPSPSERITCGRRLPNSSKTTTAINNRCQGPRPMFLPDVQKYGLPRKATGAGQQPARGRRSTKTSLKRERRIAWANYLILPAQRRVSNECDDRRRGKSRFGIRIYVFGDKTTRA